MKKYFLLIAALSVFSISAMAGFGGSRSSGGFRSSPSFSRSSSSFGGFRSAPSRSVTITRPSAPAYSPPAPHVENHYHGSGGGGSSGLVNGMILGSLMSQNHTTVVQQAPMAGTVGVADGSGALTYSANSGVVYETHGFFYYLFWTIMWTALAATILWFLCIVFTKKGYYP